MSDYYIGGLLYTFEPPDKLVLSGTSKVCPKCGRLTGSFDARACCWICLSTGCLWHEKVNQEDHSDILAELIKTRQQRDGALRLLYDQFCNPDPLMDKTFEEYKESWLQAFDIISSPDPMEAARNTFRKKIGEKS